VNLAKSSRPAFAPAALFLFAAPLLVAACDTKQPEPDARDHASPAATTHASPVPPDQGQATQNASSAAEPPVPPPPPQPKKVEAKPTAPIKVSPDDPIKGKWSIEDATKGLPAGKTIIATIETDLGRLECKMFDDKAPITVANFVGLARGLRPWKDADGKWHEKTPAYDGTVFHRIIKGFMIQGGDTSYRSPLSSDQSGKLGSGEAGYVIPDEVWEGATHDHPGSICMANRGPNTNSAQFFVMDGTAVYLDRGYTIFGECGPVDMIHKIAGVEVAGDRAKTPPVIKKVTVTRK
jgi:peptidyl-prolyl cis-trans isomerase A (cyclophilin A)